MKIETLIPFLWVLSLLLFQPASEISFADKAITHADLKIKIEGIKKKGGILHICLASDSSSFLKDCMLSESVKIEAQSTIEITLAKLAVGKYAISVFHDLNQNKILDKKSVLPIPKEPFGFSNNPRLFFGPPGYEECSFIFDRPNQEIIIRLRSL